jgi:hypothetical protein
MRKTSPFRPAPLPACLSFLVLALAFGAQAAPASAALCGDDVDGARVPCGCGDVVVSDTILSATDPVTVNRCPADGLFVRATKGTRSLRLDLDGLSIVGTGTGTGIRVIDGGVLGAVIAGSSDGRRAEIAGFSTGIFAHGRDDLQEVFDVDVKSNDDEGIVVTSAGVRLRNVRALDNGGDGMRLSGDGSTLAAVEASGNRGVGIRVSGSGSTVEGRAVGNARDGIRVQGRGHRLVDMEVRGNGRDGAVVSGDGHDTSGLRSAGNNRRDHAGPNVESLQEVR